MKKALFKNTKPDRFISCASGKAFARDKEGSIAVVFALALIPLLMLFGIAVDYSRTVSMKEAIQRAADSAVLVAVSGTDSLEVRLERAQSAFTSNLPANYRSYATLELTSANDTSISASVVGSLPTTTLRIANINTLDVIVRSNATAASSGTSTYPSVDIIACIESINSADSRYTQVLDQVYTLMSSINTSLVSKGLPQIDQVTFKAIKFMDYNFEYVIKESAIFTLPAQNNDLYTFLYTETPRTTDSYRLLLGFECVDQALNSLKTMQDSRPPESNKRIPVIAVWSEAGAKFGLTELGGANYHSSPMTGDSSGWVDWASGNDPNNKYHPQINHYQTKSGDTNYFAADRTINHLFNKYGSWHFPQSTPFSQGWSAYLFFTHDNPDYIDEDYISPNTKLANRIATTLQNTRATTSASSIRLTQ